MLYLGNKVRHRLLVSTGGCVRQRNGVMYELSNKVS